MAARMWYIQLALAVLCLGLGAAVAVQLHGKLANRLAVPADSWDILVSDLVDSNARLKQEIQGLQSQMAELKGVVGGGPMLEALVNEVNQLRIANGLVEVSGAGIEVIITGPISVLDLQDLVNELRNSGAEALALNGHRLVVWTAISTDGQELRVDGQPVRQPLFLQAIGDPRGLEVAVARPGGLISLLRQAGKEVSIKVEQSKKLTLPVSDQPAEMVYATPAE